MRHVSLVVWLGVSLAVSVGAEEKKIRVAIIDGQNNHNWKATTPILKQALESSGRYTVDVQTSPQAPPKEDKDGAKTAAAAHANWSFDLDKYDVIVSNYNGKAWPEKLNMGLEERLREGKIGLVIVHAANNAFGGWKEYDLMIGMGWRGANYGKRLKLDDKGNKILVEAGADGGSGHRYSGEFQVIVRDTEHPITKGMPREWMHARDELYDNMRGPIENVHLLATAYSKGTMAHEPMIWTVAYGKGRVFHTPMGHDVNAMRCVGFQATLNRGTEWAATGKVTLPIPKEFPAPEKSSSVP
jgi:hypothetical protein